MGLSLQIDTDENYDFFVLYDNLSPLRQKIWRKVTDLARSWTALFPSQSKIAMWCGCSRSAVSEAFQLFQAYGWMNLKSRGWKRSKTILIPHTKQQIDLVNRKYFKEVKATYRATHTLSTYRKTTSRDGLSAFQPLKIPDWLFNTKISNDSKLKLSLLPENVFQETLRYCQNRAKTGFKPDSEEQYFVGTAFKMAEKKGVKVDWRPYYNSRPK